LLEIQNSELIYQILEAILGRLLAFMQQKYYRHAVLCHSRYYGRFIQSMRDSLVMNSRMKAIFADENSSETRIVFYKNLVIRCHHGVLKTLFFDSGLINHQLVFPTNNRSNTNLPALGSVTPTNPGTSNTGSSTGSQFALDEMVVYENMLILIQKNWFHAWNMASIGIRYAPCSILFSFLFFSSFFFFSFSLRFFFFLFFFSFLSSSSFFLSSFRFFFFLFSFLFYNTFFS
jgi:hypothetical protein